MAILKPELRSFVHFPHFAVFSFVFWVGIRGPSYQQRSIEIHWFTHSHNCSLSCLLVSVWPPSGPVRRGSMIFRRKGTLIFRQFESLINAGNVYRWHCAFLKIELIEFHRRFQYYGQRISFSRYLRHSTI